MQRLMSSKGDRGKIFLASLHTVIQTMLPVFCFLGISNSLELKILRAGGTRQIPTCLLRLTLLTGLLRSGVCTMPSVSLACCDELSQ